MVTTTPFTASTFFFKETHEKEHSCGARPEDASAEDEDLLRRAGSETLRPRCRRRFCMAPVLSGAGWRGHVHGAPCPVGPHGGRAQAANICAWCCSSVAMLPLGAQGLSTASTSTAKPWKRRRFIHARGFLRAKDRAAQPSCCCRSYLFTCTQVVPGLSPQPPEPPSRARASMATPNQTPDPAWREKEAESRDQSGAWGRETLGGRAMAALPGGRAAGGSGGGRQVAPVAALPSPRGAGGAAFPCLPLPCRPWAPRFPSRELRRPGEGTLPPSIPPSFILPRRGGRRAGSPRPAPSSSLLLLPPSLPACLPRGWLPPREMPLPAAL